MANPNLVTIEDAKIIFRNFMGEEKQYNTKGERNFGVLLDDSDAQKMLEDGFNVKYLKVREDAEEGPLPQAWLPVKVGYKGRPPRVVLITGRGRSNLDESGVGTLDYVDIDHVDLIVNPYNWEVNGKKGITAYLHAIYVTIEEDELQKKYAVDDFDNHHEIPPIS
jgi:hypothetical protein